MAGRGVVIGVIVAATGLCFFCPGPGSAIAATPAISLGGFRGVPAASTFAAQSLQITPAPDTPVPTLPASKDLAISQWFAAGCLIGAPIILIALWFGDFIRPGSLARGGQRQLGPNPWLVWLFGALVIFLCAALGGSLAYRSPANRGIGMSVREMAVPQIGTYAAGLLAAFFMLRLLKQSAPGCGLGFTRADWWKGLLALGAAYPIVATTAQVSSLLHKQITGQATDPIAHESLRAFANDPHNPWAIVLMTCAVIGAPLFEESVFRGCIQSGVLKLTHRPWLSITLTTVLFTLSHWGAVPGHAFAPLAVLGIAMGIAFERTKSLGVPIVMHVGFNAINVALAATQ